MAAEVKLVCFDLGRVLVRICDDWRHASELARLPKVLDQLDEQRRATIRKLVFVNECGQMGQEEFCRRAADVLNIDARHVSAISDIYLLGAYPGTAELLDDLSKAGITTSCLSNTNAHHWALIFERDDPAYDPLLRIEHKFGSQLIGKRKPDLGIFEHVSQTVGVRGNQIVFFDDMQENIDGAAKCGWHAHLVRRDADPIIQVRAHLSQLGILG